MDRDGRQGWSRKAEEGWVRIFGDPGPRTVAFPDRVERMIVEGFDQSVNTEGRGLPGSG